MREVRVRHSVRSRSKVRSSLEVMHGYYGVASTGSVTRVGTKRKHRQGEGAAEE